MVELHAAIAGAGFMGTTHTEALRRNGVHINGIAGADPEEACDAAERLGLPCAYRSFEDMVADPDVNIIHLCTPNFLHFSQARAALEAGKHVLVEKPLAMNAQEAAELVKIARETGKVGAVNYNLRYYPLCQEAHARVRAGGLGEVRILHGEYCQDWLFLPTDWNWRLVPAEGGDLRAVADIGTHWLDMVTWITGLEVKEVMADLATFIPIRQKPKRAVETFAGKLTQAIDTEPVEIHTEDFAAVLLRFNNGARGTLTLSQVNAGRKNRFWYELNGSRASLYWDQEAPNSMWIGYRDEPNDQLIKDPSLLSPEARKFAAYPGGHAEGYPDTHRQLFKDVYAYIVVGDFSAPPSFPTFQDGLREMTLCDAIKLSAQEQRWVEVTY
jgi:predicted dehydrogenase